MSAPELIAWLGLAMYPALKFERAIDKAFVLLWTRVVVPSCKAIVPKPESRIRLAAQWVWWQITRTK